ncbi:MAG: hypothetical protein LBC10_01930, partial [Deltaproteobacteria bacterium]|nr:hypothetical protein [Deltaproteobacteria bacterium]
MALLKPLMHMGGSLLDVARAAPRKSALSSVAQLGSKFSSLMEEQTPPASPQAAAQAVRARTAPAPVKIMDASGRDPAQDAMTEQSVRNMVGALHQNMFRRPITLKPLDMNAVGKLGKPRDVLPV